MHLLRDLPALKETYPHHADVQTWAASLRAVYDQAVLAWAGDAAHRHAHRVVGDAHLWALGQQYAGERRHPCQTLAKRLLRHHGELLVFLSVQDGAPDNNAAERGVRPLVVTRKMSGGTRSSAGSDAQMVLTSVVQTCLAQSLDVGATLLRLFQSPLPQL